MDEKTLLKISMVSSIAGTALLFLISLNIGSEERPFQLLSPDDYSAISGKVSKVYIKENVTFLTVYQNRPLTAVVIGNGHLDFKEGDFVEMRGNVKEYKGKKEFVVEEIRKI